MINAGYNENNRWNGKVWYMVCCNEIIAKCDSGSKRCQ